MAIVVMFLMATPAMAADSSVDVGSNNTLFYFAGADQQNALTITGDSDSLTVTDPATDLIKAGNGCAATADPKTVTCTGVSNIEVNVRDLDDTVTLVTGLLSEVSGRDGNDVLNGGSGLDMLKGGPGNDTLNGFDGNDALNGEAGDDLLNGGAGSDTADYAISSGVTVDLNVSVPQDTGDGLDTLSEIENVDGTTGRDVITGDAGPNVIIATGGDDVIRIARVLASDSTDGSDVVNCGTGDDTVELDRSDAVRGTVATCETVDDAQVPETTVTAGPDGPTNDTTPAWQFTSDEPWADFQCVVVDTPEEIATTTLWDFCSSPHALATQAEDTSRVFAVRAVDDQTNEDATPEARAFRIDTTAPETAITSGPANGSTIDTATPTFAFSSNEAGVTFDCFLDDGPGVLCASPFTTPALGNGPHKLVVRAVDAAGNSDATLDESTVTFTVALPSSGGGGGGGGGAATPPVQQSKIIIGSLVLISGNSVKMSRKGRVSISLTCAGASRCSGRLSITTAEPVKKRSRKLVTLGSRRFGIAANKKRRVSVRFSKSKQRLAKRLKRFKAKAVIREVDNRGNPRISSRVFILRAR